MGHYFLHSFIMIKLVMALGNTTDTTTPRINSQRDKSPALCFLHITNIIIFQEVIEFNKMIPSSTWLSGRTTAIHAATKYNE